MAGLRSAIGEHGNLTGRLLKAGQLEARIAGGELAEKDFNAAVLQALNWSSTARRRLGSSTITKRQG
jgi:hypothetical protein